MSVIAVYPGMCAECRGLIEEGDIITAVADGYAHLDCTEVAEDDFPQHARRICSTCFLESPCFCD